MTIKASRKSVLNKYKLYYGYKINKFWYDRFWPITKLIPGFRKKVIQYIRTKEQFMYGCLNPSIVINKNTGTIAVSTNLAKMRHKIPREVVRIQHEKLELIDGCESIQNGMKFASVAWYSATHESIKEGYWADFHPTVIDCLVDNPIKCQQTLNDMDTSLWDELDTGLKQVPNIEKHGLYRVKD